MKTEMMKSQVVEKIAFWLRALSGSGSNFTVTRMNQKKTLLKGFFTRRLTWQRLQNNRKKSRRCVQINYTRSRQFAGINCCEAKPALPTM